MSSEIPFHCRVSLQRLAGSVLIALPLVFAVPGLTGCGGGESEPPPAISAEEISGNVPDVFKGASAEVRELATAVVEAIANQDFTAAWGHLQDLNLKPGLTDEQKDFVAQSIASVGAELQKAEEAGNEAAQRALQFHRANK